MGLVLSAHALIPPPIGPVSFNAMSLQRKFVALLTVLALAVIVNIVATTWTLKFIQRELIRPLTDMQLMLPRLGELKRSITIQASLIGGGPEGFPFRASTDEVSPEQRKPRFEAAAREVSAHLEYLENLDQYQSLVGISTTRNLHARLGRAEAAAREWFRDPSTEHQSSAIRQFVEAHDLIEKMESNVTASAASSSVDGYAPTIGASLLVGLIASFVVVVLTCVLGVILVRRWVTRPVGFLREAADRLSRGDFNYRVPVSTQDELGLLSSEVNHMAGMISTMQEERVERERLAAAGEVVRRLAHNLRNPLAGIRSLAELSRNELSADNPTRENQDRIVQTVDRFERWLAEILSATSPLKLNPETVAVAPWISGVAETLRPSATAKGVRLELDTRTAPGSSVFDPRHLEQAVVGIITNAIQASPPGQSVVISAAICVDGAAWELSIADCGPGVPQELLDKIFRLYFTTKRDGTGIGLAVAKHVVDQHAGRIRVESGPIPTGAATTGPGSKFVLKLPLAGPPNVANTGHVNGLDGASIGQDPHSRR